MATNVVNQVAYLRTSRSFPTDAQALSVEIDKTYVDVANAVNSRTIGLFPTNRPAITGESWFYNRNQRQQTLRQLYTFTTFADIPHGINTTQIAGFTRIYGTFTDGTNWYPLPYVNIVAVNQVQIDITPTNIAFNEGAGAPSVTNGFMVLEWLANV